MTPLGGKHLHRLVGTYIPHRDHAVLRRDREFRTVWRERGTERRDGVVRRVHATRGRVENWKGQLSQWAERDARAAGYAV